VWGSLAGAGPDGTINGPLVAPASPPASFNPASVAKKNAGGDAGATGSG